MGGGTPAATFQNGRVCFTLNLRNEPRGEGVISLRSAGDISLARAPRRGLIIPQSGPFPTTVIPLHSARDRESGDYAASDIQSIGSRLSGISLESSRSERDTRRGYRQMSGYRIGIDPLSPASSDYEDQESETDSQHIATVHKVINIVSLIKLYKYEVVFFMNIPIIMSIDYYSQLTSAKEYPIWRGK